jgi:thymidine kinase
MTARRTPKGDMLTAGAQIAIGGNDMYTALCRKHFMKGEAKALPVPAEKKKSAA